MPAETPHFFLRDEVRFVVAVHLAAAGCQHRHAGTPTRFEKIIWG
jgi:hypothetical protein